MKLLYANEKFLNCKFNVTQHKIVVNKINTKINTKVC